MEKLPALAYFPLPQEGRQVQPCPDVTLLLSQRKGEAGVTTDPPEPS